jgi:two-component system, LytTR family, response regulator
MALPASHDGSLAWRVLLVDRDAFSKRGIRAALESRRDVHLVGERDDARAAAELIEHEAIDIVLLDAQSTDVDALLIATRVPVESMPVFIVFTSIETLARSAFDFAAVDCLLKPFGRERLMLAVDRALARCHERNALRAFGLVSARGPRKGFRTRFLVNLGNRDTVIQADDIAWIRANGYYATLVTLDDKEFLVRLPLDQLENELDPAAFIRIHRSAIVSLQNIRGLERTAARSTVVILRSGSRIPVSRPRREALVRALGGS